MKLSPETRLRPNTPAVVSEIMDGEAIFVNFDTGHYYSLNKAGGEIWHLVGLGLPVADILDYMAGLCQGDRAAVDAAVINLLEKLIDENLLVPDLENAPQVTERPPLESESPPSRPYGLESLVLNKYSDMQELLLIDPIHEVDEQGWPNPGGHTTK